MILEKREHNLHLMHITKSKKISMIKVFTEVRTVTVSSCVDPGEFVSGDLGSIVVEGIKGKQLPLLFINRNKYVKFT